MKSRGMGEKEREAIRPTVEKPSFQESFCVAMEGGENRERKI